MPPTRTVAPSVTGGPASYSGKAGKGAVTTRSRDGLSSPPRADQISARERVSDWMPATVSGTERFSAPREPGSSEGGSSSRGSRVARTADSSRCSSCGVLVHAVTRYDSRNQRGG